MENKTKMTSTENKIFARLMYEESKKSPTEKNAIFRSDINIVNTMKDRYKLDLSAINKKEEKPLSLDIDMIKRRRRQSSPFPSPSSRETAE